MRGWIVTGLLSASLAQAGLEWEQKETVVKVHATQISADAVFRFSNTGKTPVRLVDVRVSCGCLSPKFTRRSYAPGASGEVIIQFNLRNRIGKQRKAVLVTTENNGATKLFIEADIPEAFIIKSKVVQWSKGSKEPSKTAYLKNPNPEPIKLRSITSSNPELPAELNVIREGFEYEVVISRKSANENIRSVIRIQTEPPPGATESKTLKLYVHVQ